MRVAPREQDVLWHTEDGGLLLREGKAIAQDMLDLPRLCPILHHGLAERRPDNSRERRQHRGKKRLDEAAGVAVGVVDEVLCQRGGDRARIGIVPAPPKQPPYHLSEVVRIHLRAATLSPFPEVRDREPELWP